MAWTSQLVRGTFCGRLFYGERTLKLTDYVTLTHQLALRGLTITILVTPKNLHYLNPILSTHPTSIQTLVLPFPPDQPSIPENPQNVPIQSAPDIANPLGKQTTPFWSGSKPTLFLLPQLSFPTSFLGLGHSNWPNSSGSDVVLRGVERPSMKQVAMELEEIISKGRLITFRLPKTPTTYLDLLFTLLILKGMMVVLVAL
ncbi:unnamed protein product [Prunus armeniaca]|uniref:Uncharacterized protein n=1 Tax=Prunus armeniaca TaxID=36596 RepID=A0A6J5VVR0_PRUAR|nr:unnamed protein product [Prunus armeniaca]